MTRTRHILPVIILMLSALGAEAQNSYFSTPTVETYALHGNVKEVLLTGQLIDMDKTDTLYLHFNEDGILLESRYSTYVGELPNTTYRYNDGKIVERLNFDDSSCFHDTYLYGADGCLTEVIRTYSEEEKIIDIDTFYFICDEFCRITAEGRVYPTRYTYNEAGLVATMTYDDNLILYEYDAQNLLEKEIWKEGGSEKVTVYIRDEYGNITDEIISYPHVGTIKRHVSYNTLDRHGNWTTLTEDGMTFQRSITYYDE